MKRISDYRKTIRKWEARFKENPYCEPGSDLHIDTTRFPAHEGGLNYNSGKMVARAISTGVRSLSSILVLENDQRRNGVNVPALSVLSRTGMVSGSFAVWLLEPDDADVRLERGLQLAKENVRQLKAFADKDEVYSKTVDPKMSEAARIMRAAADVEIEELDRMMIDHDFNLRKKIEDTAILFQVAELLNGYDDDTADYRKPVLDAWRLDSGFAHALAWPYDLGFSREPHEFYEDAVAAPMLLMNLAIHLLDVRRMKRPT